MRTVVIDRRLYLDSDKTQLVEEGSFKAAFLWHAEGQEISVEEAEKFGYKPREKREAAKAAPEKVEAKTTPKRGRPRKSK